MAKLWAWVSGPVWHFLKDHWKLLAGAALALGAVWAGKQVTIAIGKKIVPPVTPTGPVTVPGGKVTVRREHDPL